MEESDEKNKRKEKNPKKQNNSEQGDGNTDIQTASTGMEVTHSLGEASTAVFFQKHGHRSAPHRSASVCGELPFGSCEGDLSEELDAKLTELDNKIGETLKSMKQNTSKNTQDGLRAAQMMMVEIRAIRKKMLKMPKPAPAVTFLSPLRKASSSSPTPQSQKKRGRTSPIASGSNEKKPRRTEDCQWQTVGKGGKRAARPQEKDKTGKKGTAVKKKSAVRRKERNQAIAIKPSVGKTYSDVAAFVRAQLKSVEDVANGIGGVHKARNGDVLVDIVRGSEKAELIKAKLKEGVETVGTARELSPKVELEFRNLEPIITPDEIKDDIKAALGGTDPCITRVFISKENSRGVKLAIVEVPQSTANMLMAKAIRRKIRIGLINSEVRIRVPVTRCFKCLGYGHISKECQGPDRTKMCFKCGSNAHKGKDCKDSPNCVLCAAAQYEETRHVPGAGACRVFRRALEEAKQRDSKWVRRPPQQA